MKDNIYYFIAIGGVGQSALAKILLEQGFRVEGSDINESKYSKQLKELGAKINIGHDKNNIKENMTLVISSAIKEDNPELKRARELNLTVYHRSDMLKIISQNCKNFIGFSGTHGKTTTSGLCSYILEKLNAKPSYAIGGIIPELHTNAKSTLNYKDSIFVAELDESDGTIVKYSPNTLVINNLEADHLDFYKNGLEQILEIFKSIYDNNLKNNSKVIVNIDNDGVKKLLKLLDVKHEIITFSLSNKNANYYVDSIQTQNEKSKFNVYNNGKLLGDIEISIPGEHNIYNSLSVISTLCENGFKFDDFKEYFRDFHGMGRRFQSVAKFKEIEVIDDYAHHPTEIKSTLEAAKKYTNGRIVAIFQPHRYTRLKALWNDFMESFDNVDLLIVLDVFSAGDKPSSEYNSEIFQTQIKHKNCKYIGGGIEEASKEIYKLLTSGDTVLTLGAGDITKMGGFLNDEYKKHNHQN